MTPVAESSGQFFLTPVAESFGQFICSILGLIGLHHDVQWYYNACFTGDYTPDGYWAYTIPLGYFSGTIVVLSLVGWFLQTQFDNWVDSRDKRRQKVVEQPVQTVSEDKSALELEFWKSIKDSDDTDLYQAYIDQFPEGVYVSIAKSKLKNQ